VAVLDLDAVALKDIAKALVLPPGGLLLVATLGLALLRRRPRLGRWLASLGVLGLLALSLPVVAGWLTRVYVGDLAALDLAHARDAQAIVILGSGVRRTAPEYGGAAPSGDTLERLRYGARLARQTHLPVLVAGGAVRNPPAEADVMRQTLQQDYGVTVRWQENRSRNTRENARRTAEILRPLDIRRVLLVAQAIDMRRAQAEFVAAGLQPIPAAVDLPSPDDQAVTPWLPSMRALADSWRVAYEALGDLVRRLMPGG
jgi:uncharacterized SAM-binding protein YcdF (DUF218 family)